MKLAIILAAIGFAIVTFAAEKPEKPFCTTDEQCFVKAAQLVRDSRNTKCRKIGEELRTELENETHADHLQPLIDCMKPIKVQKRRLAYLKRILEEKTDSEE